MTVKVRGLGLRGTGCRVRGGWGEGPVGMGWVWVPGSWAWDGYAAGLVRREVYEHMESDESLASLHVGQTRWRAHQPKISG